MDKLLKQTGRRYNYLIIMGSPDAERNYYVMGSGAETVEETIDYLAIIE